MKNVLNGFKEFIARGNALELAIGVVIGAAFGDLVKSLTENLINPLIAAIFGKPDMSNVFVITLRDDARISFGAILTALINFLIVAAAIYFIVVLPLNKLQNLRKKPGTDPEPEAPAEDVVLLEQIRDLLAAQSSAGPAGPDGPQVTPRH